jgi:hypothetical protein
MFCGEVNRAEKEGCAGTVWKPGEQNHNQTGVERCMSSRGIRKRRRDFGAVMFIGSRIDGEGPHSWSVAFANIRVLDCLPLFRIDTASDAWEVPRRLCASG